MDFTCNNSEGADLDCDLNDGNCHRTILHEESLDVQMRSFMEIQERTTYHFEAGYRFIVSVLKCPIGMVIFLFFLFFDNCRVLNKLKRYNNFGMI